MMGFYLLDTLPSTYSQVMKTDGAKFNQLFHCLLDRGVYIAPALYEAGFVSAAHTDVPEWRLVTLPFSQMHETRLEVSFAPNQLEPDLRGRREGPIASSHRHSQTLAETLKTNRSPGR